MWCNLDGSFHKLNGQVSQNLHIAVITTQVGIFVTPSVSIFAWNDRQFMWKLPPIWAWPIYGKETFHSSSYRALRKNASKYARLKFSPVNLSVGERCSDVSIFRLKYCKCAETKEDGRRPDFRRIALCSHSNCSQNSYFNGEWIWNGRIEMYLCMQLCALRIRSERR